MEPLDIEALKEKAEPVKVKPLEWLERDYYYAYVPTFPTGYCVSFEDAKHWLTLDGIRKVGEDTFRGPYPSRDEAVAAAQADYEQRILSALDLSELSRLRSENEGMRKALQLAKDMMIANGLGSLHHTFEVIDAALNEGSQS